MVVVISFSAESRACEFDVGYFEINSSTLHTPDTRVHVFGTWYNEGCGIVLVW